MAVMPLILYLKATQIPKERYKRCIQVIESYLVRRMLYGRITQGLTSFLINMLERIHQERPNHYEETMVTFLDSQTNDTFMWPNDRILADSLTGYRLGGTVRRRKMVLVEIERHMRRTVMAEPLGDTSKLTIEHVMPRQWEANWRLPSSASPEDRYRREDSVNSLGNLTLTTDRLNTRLSNGPWDEKRTVLENHSTLLLNRELLSGTTEDWDEDAIEARSTNLAARIIDIWKSAQWFIDNRL